eukprot:356348-Chlamydomonas_euryale.AAC.8
MAPPASWHAVDNLYRRRNVLFGCNTNCRFVSPHGCNMTLLVHFSATYRCCLPIILHRYLCNFGALRRRLTGIEIKASQCHVQITSHEGDGYKVFMRTQKGCATMSA